MFFFGVRFRYLYVSLCKIPLGSALLLSDRFPEWTQKIWQELYGVGMCFKSIPSPELR